MSAVPATCPRLQAGMVHAASYDHPLKHPPHHWHRKHPQHNEVLLAGNFTRDSRAAS